MSTSSIAPSRTGLGWFPPLKPRSIWNKYSDWRYTFSRATFESTNLSQYEVVLDRLGATSYQLQLIRRHYVDCSNANLVPTDTFAFSVNTEEGVVSKLQNLLDPTKYRTWSDGTLVEIHEWEQRQRQAGRERTLLGI